MKTGIRRSDAQPGRSAGRGAAAPRPPLPTLLMHIAGLALWIGVSALCCAQQRAPTLASVGPGAPLDVQIPQQADWTDYGTILEPGELGDWDFQLWGAFAASAVKKDGTYHLYYQGSCCYRIVDDSVTWRAIGVASSPDGINFTKHPGNPVITWSPTPSGEEGAVSSAALLDPRGEVVLFYGASTEETPITVNTDARVAVSPDGVAFSDQGLVLDHSDPQVWGSGDELYPVTAFADGGQWHLYYIPGGSPQQRTLGVAWGPEQDQLDDSTGARSGGNPVPAWGTAGAARLGPGTWALFINDLRVPQIEVYSVTTAAPDQLSAPLATYQFADFRQGTVLLDEEANTWFLYYRDERQLRYGVKLAPAGPPDTTPPLAPPAVTPDAVDHREIELTWQPADDPETGIVQYRVFRDGAHLTTVKGWSYRDTGLEELTSYSYEVSAINYHGLEGPKSVPALLTTPADVTPPALAEVAASGDPARLLVVFDEPVEQASAEQLSNYALSHDLGVLGAALEPDGRTVTLTVAPQSEHQTYLLTVSGVLDRAQTPNAIVSPLRRTYSFSSAAGLAASWRLDEGEDLLALDTGGTGQDGSLLYPGKVPATWSSGLMGGALDFDGLDDLVTLPGEGTLADATDGSHTFTGWAQAARVPPDSAPHNSKYSVLTRRYTGLHYDHQQRFRATARTASGDEATIEAGPYAPLAWHHLAMVVDDDARQVRLYVDGAEVSGSPQGYSGDLADLGDVPFYIGTSDPLVERWDYRFEGLLDEIRVYDRALTTPEVAALASDPPELSYAVAAVRTGSGSGTVTSDPPGIDCGADCEQTFAAGTEVALTASADPGSSFAGWSGHSDCADGSLTVLGTRLCTAAFTLESLTLTVVKEGTGSGTVTSDPPGIDCGPNCSAPFPPGTVIGLTPTPDPGSEFRQWRGHPDCLDGEVTLTTDLECIGQFWPEGVVFEDGFESGDTSVWTWASSPQGAALEAGRGSETSTP